jgi:hypothetical protein
VNWQYNPTTGNHILMCPSISMRRACILTPNVAVLKSLLDDLEFGSLHNAFSLTFRWAKALNPFTQA